MSAIEKAAEILEASLVKPPLTQANLLTSDFYKMIHKEICKLKTSKESIKQDPRGDIENTSKEKSPPSKGDQNSDSQNDKSQESLASNQLTEIIPKNKRATSPHAQEETKSTKEAPSSGPKPKSGIQQGKEEIYQNPSRQ